MIFCKKMLLLVVLAFGCSQTHISVLMAQADIRCQPNKQQTTLMANFKNQIKLYTRCLKGKCSPEERQKIESTLLRVAGGLIAGFGIGFGIASYQKSWPKI